MNSPTEQELANADYGYAISQQEAQRQVRDFLSTRLKDPGSAQYQWGSVYQGWMRHARIHGAGVVFGYILNVSINAKNSFGAYNGFKPYEFVFHNGSILTVYGERELNGGMKIMGRIY